MKDEPRKPHRALPYSKLGKNENDYLVQTITYVLDQNKPTFGGMNLMRIYKIDEVRPVVIRKLAQKS